MLLLIAGLIGFAGALACVTGPVLSNSVWPMSRPGTAVACWAAALSGTALAMLGVVAVGLLGVPCAGHGFVETVRDCLPGHHHAGMAIATTAGLVMLVLVAGRMTGAISGVRRMASHRREHREMLDLVARTDDDNKDVLVLDHPLPVAYCLPPRGRPIVVTSGAREGLSAEQFEAVLAHERAHLRHRHHLLLLILELVSTALPWPPTMRQAKRCMPPLLEMAADDDAALAHGPRTVADALRRLVALPGPAGSLAAACGDTTAMSHRLARLDRPETRRHRLSGLLAWLFVAFAVATPTMVITIVIAETTVFC